MQSNGAWAHVLFARWIDAAVYNKKKGLDDQDIHSLLIC